LIVPVRTAPGGQSEAGSALCLSCGLCCDGALYDHVKLEREDRERLAENGFEAPDRLSHPCPHFIEQSCSIYAIRPWRCGDYQCEVLKQLYKGEIDAGAAHALVEQAKELRETVKSSLPEGLTIACLAQEVKAGKDNRSPSQLLALVRFAAYRLFVERHFLPLKARWMTRQKV
jgi:Fe-S-cluster containining protein